MREDYTKGVLMEDSAATDPIVQFRRWMDQAIAANVIEPNAMTLSTIDSDGSPDARIVLLKGISDGAFVFYTNYESPKAQQMAAEDRVCLTFLWKAVQQQIRITGTVAKVSAEESDAYFDSRPKGSRIGAWASPQSQVIEGRELLDANLAQLSEQYATQEKVPRPPHWGGYAVTPTTIEFWQGRSSRLHDRLRYSKSDGHWTIRRLAP